MIYETDGSQLFRDRQWSQEHFAIARCLSITVD